MISRSNYHRPLEAMTLGEGMAFDPEEVYQQLPSDLKGLQERLEQGVEMARRHIASLPEESKVLSLLQQTLERLKAYGMLFEGVVLATGLRVVPEMFLDNTRRTGEFHTRVEAAVEQYLRGLMILDGVMSSAPNASVVTNKTMSAFLSESRVLRGRAMLLLREVLDTPVYGREVPDYALVLHTEAVRRLKEIELEYVDLLGPSSE